MKVTSLDGKGAGVAEHDGRRLAVWGGLPGEQVRARYLFGRRFRGQAEMIEVLEAAADRVTAPCPSFGTCSACALQHLAASSQLAFKQQRLLETLREQGEVVPLRTIPVLDADRWHYRRKARLSVRYVARKERVLIGFRERDGRFVTDMQACHTLHPLAADALPALATLIDDLEARATIPQIEVSCGDDSAALVFRHLEPLAEADRERLLGFEHATGLRLYLQPKGPDTVHPLSPGPSRLTYRLPREGLEFGFEPLDFIQVNQSLNERMISQALDLLEPGPDSRVLDLFCGLGNFTLPLAKRVKEVVGLEGSADLVQRGRENAQRNDINNVLFTDVDLYGEQVSDAWPSGSFDALLLDPPRSGAGPVLDRIAATGAQRILYVSCNPETLAADAAELVRTHGYRLESAGAMDMFPQTTHIEAMALFLKSNPEGAHGARD